MVWPPVQRGIQAFGQSVLTSDYGPALYAAGKRLLIPLGLHHVYYPPFLFEFGEFVNSAGQTLKGESARYFGGDPSAGRFMAAEFPIMLFGLPMAALAMVLRAPANKRKIIGGIMMSAALTSIITGITEPIEFAFIFVAPLLFVLHVALAFISGLLTAQFDIHLGYTFSASLIDFIVGFFNQKNSMALWFIVGPIIGACYFTGFYYLIGLFNLKTVGRETEDTASVNATSNSSIGNNLAENILNALGGASNIASLDACITRLRVTVNNSDIVNKEQFKNLGAAGVMNTGKNFQIIFGVQSDKIKEDIKSLMNQSAIINHSDIENSNYVSNSESSSQLISNLEFDGFLIPIAGDILNIEHTPDETFSQKILGEGFLINPVSGIVCSPFDGEVLHLFPTNHAIVLKRADDLEVLIHIGIDTVKMKGKGFNAFVKIGDQVKKGQKLLEFDLALVKAEAKSHLTLIIFTNPDKIIELPSAINKERSRLIENQL